MLLQPWAQRIATANLPERWTRYHIRLSPKAAKASPKLTLSATQLNPEGTVNRYRREAAHQLAEVTLERHAIYGSSLPMEQEELRKLVEKSLGEKVPENF